jgi:hypothetical protein
MPNQISLLNFIAGTGSTRQLQEIKQKKASASIVAARPTTTNTAAKSSKSKTPAAKAQLQAAPKTTTTTSDSPIDYKGTDGPFTTSQDTQLLTLKNSSKSWKEIATAINKPHWACKNRFKQLQDATTSTPDGSASANAGGKDEKKSGGTSNQGSGQKKGEGGGQKSEQGKGQGGGKDRNGSGGKEKDGVIELVPDEDFSMEDVSFLLCTPSRSCVVY